MNFYKFMGYTLAGAFPWCLVLAYLGYTLGSNWESLMQYTHILAYAIGGLVLLLILGMIALYVLVRRGVVKKETVMRYLKFITHI